MGNMLKTKVSETRLNEVEGMLKILPTREDVKGNHDEVIETLEKF